MRGCIVKRQSKDNPKQPLYYVVYRLGGRQKWEGAGPNKKDAERRLAEIVSAINNGSYATPSAVTFREFAERWIEGHASSVKASTAGDYRFQLRKYILPALGDLPLQSVNTERILALKGEILKIVSPRTTNYVLTTLKMIFTHARRLKYIRENPMEDMKKAKIEHKEMDFLTPDEIKRLLDNADEPFRTLFLLAVSTGLRRGEILGLCWGDIDWRKSVIFVKRSVYWGEKDKDPKKPSWQFHSPKSKRSIRVVIMSPELKKALEIHKINSPDNPSNLVFTSQNGTPLYPSNFIRKEFIPALERAGLRHIRFHDLRHTHTTLLIHQGANIKFIQAQLGHASIQTTLDRYGHLLPVSNEGVGIELDKQIFGQSNNDLTDQARTPANTVHA